MLDADIIVVVRRLRKLVSTLDSIGFPIKELSEDEDLSQLVSNNLHTKVIKVSGEIHNTLQNIEKSKKYKDVVKRLCNIKERL